MDIVNQALAANNGATISILFDAEHTGGARASDRFFHPVLELAVDGRTVRSYAQVREAYRSDDQIGLWCGAFFILSSCYLLFCAMRQARAQQDIGTIALPFNKMD